MSYHIGYLDGQLFTRKADTIRGMRKLRYGGWDINSLDPNLF